MQTAHQMGRGGLISLWLSRKYTLVELRVRVALIESHAVPDYLRFSIDNTYTSMRLTLGGVKLFVLLIGCATFTVTVLISFLLCTAIDIPLLRIVRIVRSNQLLLSKNNVAKAGTNSPLKQSYRQH
jgi:hypothetical protein